ncbi:MAG: PEGA domain-containing protein, partial [Myxococcales bacterium]|nr:PEGA domain-containing protein [Myxococcales bacterium]
MIHRSFRFLALGAIALGVLGAVPGAARAERSALFVAGVKASERAGVTKTARATIESAGWTVIEPPLDDGPLADLVTCVGSGLGGDCVPGYLDDHDVDRGVILRISTEGKGGTTKVVTGWVFRRAGELLVTDKRYCQKCEAPAFEASVRELVDALIVAARERARPTLLDVRTIPTGATVKVDGKVAGQADLQVEVYAGVHNVFFELPGYRGESREVVVGDGESMSVEVRLTPADQAPPRGPVRPGA